MRTLEAEITDMPRELQLALQHVARAECLGVEVLFSHALPTDKHTRETLIQRALGELQKRLLWAGVL